MIQYSPSSLSVRKRRIGKNDLTPSACAASGVERAQMLMRKYGVAALLEANHHNIRYLTALKGFAYPMCRYVLFFAEHDAVMYEHDGYYHQMPDQCPWIKEWRPARSWLTGAPGPGRLRGRSESFRRRNQSGAGKTRLAWREARPWQFRRQRARSVGQRRRKKYRRYAQSHARSAHDQKSG